MKINKLHYLLLTTITSLLLYSACVSELPRLAKNTITVNPTEKNKILYSEVFDSVRYVKLETTDDILIKDISVTRCVNNRIYILDEDTQTLFSFDAHTGKCFWKICNIGQGPGEYTSLTDFDIDEKNNRLYLFSHYQKILEYDLSGKYISEYLLPFRGFSFACKDDYFYVYTGNISRQRDDWETNYRLLVYNKTDGSVKGRLPFADNPNIGINWSVNPTSAFYHYKDALRYYSLYSNPIYTINGENVSIEYNFDFSKYNLPEDYFDTHGYNDLEQTDYAYGLNLCWENERFVCASIKKNQMLYQILFSKKEKRVSFGTFWDDLEFCVFQFVTATDDFALGYLSADACVAMEPFANSKNSIRQKVASDVTGDDNPVLFFYYFKN